MPKSPPSVEQIDRDAAADLALAQGRTSRLIDAIKRGAMDHGESVQAFARHRLAERERIAAFVEAWNGDTRDGDTFLIAEEIRTGDKP